MKLIIKLLVVLALIFCLFFIVTSIVLKEGAKPVADGTAKYAIVLGAKVNRGGIPSKALKNRLDAAYDYSLKYPNVQFILSGGQGDDEDEPEAISMKRYLMDRGMSEFQLIIEDESTSTYENIKYSMVNLPLTEEKVTIISNDFHLARAQMIAKHLGLKSDVVAAKTPTAIKLKVTMRERAGLIAQKLALLRK